MESNCGNCKYGPGFGGHLSATRHCMHPQNNGYIFRRWNIPHRRRGEKQKPGFWQYNYSKDYRCDMWQPKEQQ